MRGGQRATEVSPLMDYVETLDRYLLRWMPKKVTYKWRGEKDGVETADNDWEDGGTGVRLQRITDKWRCTCSPSVTLEGFSI